MASQHLSQRFIKGVCLPPPVLTRIECNMPRTVSSIYYGRRKVLNSPTQQAVKEMAIRWQSWIDLQHHCNSSLSRSCLSEGREGDREVEEYISYCLLY